MLGLQVWESLLPVYFSGLVLSAKCLGLRPKIQIKKMLAAGVIWAAVAAVPLLAYWGVAWEFGYKRSIREAAHNGLSVDELGSIYESPGLYVLLAVAVLKIKRVGQAKWLAAVVVISAVMALGPVLKWGGKTVKVGGRIPIPLPYAAAYYTVAGFGELQTPSRWIWLSGWAASGLIALGLKNYNLRLANKKL